MKTGWVTVVITAYNAGRYIQRSIDSVLRQAYPKVKVIAVDDCSTDNTRQVVEGYSKERVTYVRLSENSGPAVGRTTGLKLCDSEYVAFLDSDDYWHSDFLRTTTEFLKTNTDAIAVCTGYVKKDWKGNDYHGPELDETDSRFYSAKGRVIPDFFSFWSKYMNILTGTVLMRTEYALATRGQREELRLTEDLEFCGYLGTFGRWGFIPQHLFITDQRILSPKERLTKLGRKFSFSGRMSLSDWEKRIVPRLDAKGMEGFQRVRSHIVTIIAVANAYNFNFEKSYQLSHTWTNELDGGLGTVLRVGAKCGPLLFPLFCFAIRFREYMKTYTHYFLRSSFSISRKIIKKST